MKTLRYYIDLIAEGELIEPKITNKTVQKLDPDKLNKIWQQKSGETGGGYYAYAKELNPHEIRLTTFKPSYAEDDAKFQYLNAVRPIMGDNPYAPNIYEIKITQAKNLGISSLKPQYITQKLVHYYDLPILNLYKACEPIIKSMTIDKRIFNPIEAKYQDLKNTFNSIQKDIMYSDMEDPIGQHRYMSNDAFLSANPLLLAKDKCINLALQCIQELINNRIKSNDSNLTQITTIIRNVKLQNNKFRIDLHEENVMFRPSRANYQLVITDPLSDK